MRKILLLPFVSGKYGYVLLITLAIIIVPVIIILKRKYRLWKVANDKRKAAEDKMAKEYIDFYWDNIEKEKEFKECIDQFTNEMKKIPDWYNLIQHRGNVHAFFAKKMNVKVDDYEYFAKTYQEEYMLKYNDGNLDIEDINLRIEKFGFIVAELEKVIKKAAELKFNITHEMHNDYCVARASILAAEYALKEMTK